MCIEICKGSPETELRADRRACNQASNPLLFRELSRRCAERRRWTEAAIVYEHWSTWMTQPVSTLARINSRGYHLRRKPAPTAHSIKETNFHIRKKSVLSLTFPDFWPPQSILLLSPDKSLHCPPLLLVLLTFQRYRSRIFPSVSIFRFFSIMS